MFECDRCGYTTNTKFCMQKHYARTNICPPTNSNVDRELLVARDFPKRTTAYQCEKCMKYFASPQCKWNHKPHCRMDCAVVQFGHEKIDITCRRFRDIIWDLMKNYAHNINWYIVYKFFDDAHPENHTLRRPFTNDYIQCHIDGEWRQDSCENVITQIMRMLESDVIDIIQGLPNRDEYLKREGEFYMYLYRLITRIGRPFQFTRLAALMEDCKIDISDECDDEEDLESTNASLRLSRSLLITRISTTIFNQTTRQAPAFNSAA